MLGIGRWEIKGVIMKRSHLVGTGGLRGHRLISSPISASSLSFDDLYQDISDHWQERSRKLQARRWRKIKHQLV